MCLLILKAGGQIVLGGVEEGEGEEEAELADVTPALMKSGTQAQRSRLFFAGETKECERSICFFSPCCCFCLPCRSSSYHEEKTEPVTGVMMYD